MKFYNVAVTVCSGHFISAYSKEIRNLPHDRTSLPHNVYILTKINHNFLILFLHTTRKLVYRYFNIYLCINFIYSFFYLFILFIYLFIDTTKTLKGADRIKSQVASDLINSLPDSTSTLPTSEHANQMENLILHQESPKPYLG